MKGNAGQLVRFGAGLSAIVMAAWILSLQAAEPLEGFTTDWTHHHVIFSKPATNDQARIVAVDPRYWHEWYSRNINRQLLTESGDSDMPPLESVFNSKLPSKSRSDWSMDMGSGASAGVNNYPAKYSFRTTTASCGSSQTPDYVVFSTGLLGSILQANIVAYDNLYSGCSGTVPTVYWAYNTTGQVLTSPVISGDGTQVAFIQTNGVTASLVVLKWSAGTGSIGSPTTLLPVATTSYRACSAPCMTEVPLKNGLGVLDNDTTSSGFPDYSHDVIWVGGATGWLHKISGVFRGTPAEVATGGFPVQVNTGSQLSSPVYDISSGNVFVSDKGGFLYRVAAGGTVTTSGRVDHAAGLLAGPVVDSTAGTVYVFSSNDGSTICAGGTPCAAVFAFSNAFIPGSTGRSEGTAGPSSASANQLYEGAFDGEYWASGTATGNVYVCGATGIAPAIYRVAVKAGAMGTGPRVATLTPAANHPACSSVTDVSNPNASPGPTDRLFFSVQNNGLPTACAASGCAMSFVSTPWQAATPYRVGQEILVERTASQTMFVNVAILAGTSGATQPTWPNAIGATTTDGGVLWLNQGGTTVATLASWVARHTYALRAQILDSNGNVQIVTKNGTSGTGTPTWKTVAGQTTTDATVTWTNAGALPTANLSATGGTSGIIIDNVSTATGASQIYFSTLSNQTCTGGTGGSGSGSGGCAVQASQSALK